MPDNSRGVVLAVGGVTGAEFDESAMVTLPMDNYSTLVVPGKPRREGHPRLLVRTQTLRCWPVMGLIADTWTSFYAALAVEDKAVLYEAIWDACAVDERSRIMHDIGHFFAPAMAGDAATATSSGSAAGMLEEITDDSDDDDPK